MTRRVAGVLALVLFALPFVPSPARADDALSIAGGSTTAGLFDVLEIVAAGAGYYKEAHLDVTKQYAGGASTAAQLVASGKVDLCVISVEPALVGYEKGVRLQFFLSRQSQYSYVIGVLNDSPIRRLADFKGKEIGEVTVGTLSEVAADSMLAGAGLNRSDYSFVPIGYGAQALQAVLSKRVAATIDIYASLITDEVAAGTTFRIFHNPILSDIANVGYGGLPATIAAKSDVLKRFSRAIVKAAVFVRADPQAAARLYLEGSGQKVTPAALATQTHLLTLLENELPASDLSSRRIGYLSPRGLELYSRYLVDYGFAHQVVPGTAIATDRFIDYANDFDHQAVERFAKSLH
jgi:NitT/TauT family transport system substrate-binding protein